jgi:NAD(P)-dependent dehydrogenase (short-subunit alcohol dehydrogenase family)
VAARSTCGSFFALSAEAWWQELNQNLMSAVRLDRALLPSVIQQGSGVIIHVASIQQALRCPRRQLPMPPPKLRSRPTARACRKRRPPPEWIRVVRISSGWVETRAAVALAEPLAAQAGTDYQGGKQIIMKNLGGIPLGRPALPMEVADSLLPSFRPGPPRLRCRIRD